MPGWQTQGNTKIFTYVMGGVKFHLDLKGLSGGVRASQKQRKKAPDWFREIMQEVAGLATSFWNEAYQTLPGNRGYGDRVMPTIYSGELGEGVEFRVSPAGNRLIYINRTRYADIIENTGMPPGQLGSSVPKTGRSADQGEIRDLAAWGRRKLGLRTDAQITALIDKVNQYGYDAPAPLATFSEPTGQLYPRFITAIDNLIRKRLYEKFGTGEWVSDGN